MIAWEIFLLALSNILAKVGWDIFIFLAGLKKEIGF